jgi:hypothetical protein
MSETNFKDLQKEVCSPELEPPPLKKFCAPCVPNQSYIEPDWEFVEIGEPYLNEKQCEYQITLTVNKFGDSFTAKQLRNLKGNQESFESRELLLRSFIHPAIVLILEEYGKLVADQIICSGFPAIPSDDDAMGFAEMFSSFDVAFMSLSEQKVDQERVRCLDVGTKQIPKIDPSEPFDFTQTIIKNTSDAEILNPFALELYAQVNDFYIDPIENILKVHVGIPAFIVDQVPELPSKEELEEEAVNTRETVTLEVDKLFGQFKRLETSLLVFGKYQSQFYQSQDGFLKFKESGKDFYANRMSSKLGVFYSDLVSLAKKNDVNIRSNIPSLVRLNADKIRIDFKTGPNGNPYMIKSIHAWKEGCEEKKLRKGIKKFKKEYNRRPSVVNYVAKLSDIDKSLQARETMPWLDFLIKYTYPLVIVDYGNLSMAAVGDTLGKCVEENVREFGGELRDYILSEALSFMDSLSYQYSSAASCEELYSTENQPEVKEFENNFDAGKEAKRETAERLEDDPISVIQEQYQEKLDPLEDKLRILKMQEDSKRKEIERLEKLPRDYNGEVQYQVKESIFNANKQIVNLVVEISATESEIDKIKYEGLGLIKESYSEDGLSRKASRQLRKNAAKKARRNRKKHPYAKKAYRAAMEEIQKKDTLLSSLVDWEEYEKNGKLSRKKFEKRAADDSWLKGVVKRMSICNAQALTVNAVRCLFSGVTKERAFDKMFRAAMQAMDLDVFGFFIGGLPPDKQAELRKKLEAEFGNIPLPWEDGYDSGAESKNAYKSYLSADATGAKDKSKEKNALRQQIRTLKTQIRDLEKSIGTAALDSGEKIGNIDIEIKKKEDFLKADPEQVPDGFFENVTLELEALRKERQNLQQEADPRMPFLNQNKKDLESLEASLDSIDTIVLSSTGLGEEFDAMTDEEKTELIKEQKKAQGTFGTPLGNVQEAVVEAYIEYVFDVMNIDEIGDALSSVPGGSIVFNTLEQIFKCSTQGLFDPPIKSFLSSLTLDVCGPTRHVGLAIPSKIKPIAIPEGGFNRAFFLTKLKNAFVAKLETVVTKVITMFLLKLFEAIDNALCKSINALGQFAIGQLTGGSSAGLDEAFADAFCPDADDDELNAIKKNAFGNALGKGAAPDSAYECLFKAVNGTMSKREIIDLLTNTPNNMDDQTAGKFAALVNSRCPELSDLLGNIDDVKDAFGSIGRFIPPELREYLKDQGDDDLDAPIYDAVCLTQDELDQWNADRKDAYLNNGLDEDTADELINKANERALDNLGSLADMLQRGPQGLLEDALAAVLDQADPACANDPSAIIMEDEVLAKDKQNLLNDYFKRIESLFLKDLIGESRSLLGNILIDTLGNHLQQHNRRVKVGDRTFLFANYVDTEEQWDKRKEDAGFIKDKIMDKGDERGMVPETVGLQMLEQLKIQELKYKTSKDDPQLKMFFEDSSESEYKSVLNYKLKHNEKSTQRVFVRETRAKRFLGKTYGEDKELITTSRRNQVFNKEELGLVNYEIIPNEIKLLSDLLKRKSSASKSPRASKMISFFDEINTEILKTIRNIIIQTPKGDIPVGFNYGYDEQESIGFEDLLYVNPDADPNDESTWDYTFDEEDAVLGKSATENPRVYFLDPLVHGGRYKAPKIYIEPATYNGWLGTIKAFIPQLDACEDKDNGFLNMTEIAKRAKKIEGNLPVDTRLNEPLECRLEVPYDRQLMPANHGLLEGIVMSTVRVYASELMVRSFPVFGSIQFSDLNTDSLITKVLADKMEQEMSEAGYLSSISRLAYYLLFLEQSVQVVQRQIIDGLMEETEEIREASKIINRAQNNYEKLRLVDLLTGQPLPDGVSAQLSKGSRILAYGNKWESIVQSENLNFRTLNGYKINLARKVSVIHDTQQAAEVFLAALITKETTILSKKLNLNLRPRPAVFDIKKFMLSTSGILDQSDIKSGFATVEQEIVEGSNKPNYGDILNCSLSDLKSPLGIISKDPAEIEKTGVMYLEKYVRVFQKDTTQQVMSIPEFQSMIANRSIYSEDSLISDHFGNASIIAGRIDGTIGVKFGVRLMFCLPHSFDLIPTLDRSIERLPNAIGPTPLHHIPVCSYELDVMDVQIKEIDLEDSNMGEDLKCYVDRLSEEPDFKLLFEKIFKTKSFVSMFGIYSYDNFIESIGKLEVEEKSQKLINQGWKKRIFNDTKRVLRKQFRSVYNSQDDTSNKRASRNRDANLNFLKNLIPDLYLNISGVGFLQRLRIVEAKPFDEDGKPCVNEFQKLFEDD